MQMKGELNQTKEGMLEHSVWDEANLNFLVDLKETTRVVSLFFLVNLFSNFIQPLSALFDPACHFSFSSTSASQ